MSDDIVQTTVDNNNVMDLLTTLATPAADTQLNESDTTFPTPSDSEDAANNSAVFGAESLVYSEYSIFGTFVVIELVMTTLELFISIVAAIKMERWRKNYRNQMLMQLTVARFIKRIIFTFKFLDCRDKLTDSEAVANFLYCFQLYIDLVIVVLVFFFIKHMYNSLIIVLVKISQNSFYKVMSYSWLIPIPIAVVCTAIIFTDLVDKWYVNLLMCSVFRWPLIFVGTGVYITIVYRVLSDKIRQFARSLAVVTFLLCLTINVYLFSKDIMELWCLKSLMTLLIGYISGFLMNVLILVLYIILLILTYQNKTQSSRSLPDYSLADANMKC
ncbi:unnamed protein product [Spodoptera littoralis]|uniref:Uncharacterized protein n=1 Tax=Spodoptera littoralis TaxID=7109 RepID=A0A9P0N171_SPOLI|nr:unnamed protein product [Spodoptera littoralis]CAH1638705.1 unnamed protein product [Spodoptera littoralis]